MLPIPFTASEKRREKIALILTPRSIASPHRLKWIYFILINVNWNVINDIFTMWINTPVSKIIQWRYTFDLIYDLNKFHVGHYTHKCSKGYLYSGGLTMQSLGLKTALKMLV